jgi:hypothetical protein
VRFRLQITVVLSGTVSEAYLDFENLRIQQLRHAIRQRDTVLLSTAAKRLLGFVKPVIVGIKLVMRIRNY